MTRTLAAALLCAAHIPTGAGEPSVASGFFKNAEQQICSAGNQIKSALDCQAAGTELKLDLTTTEVQTQNTPFAASGCYFLEIPARRSDTGYAVRQLWFNTDNSGSSAADQFPLCGAAGSAVYSGAGKYHCHMAYCIESEHGTFSKEECYEAQQNGCRAPPTYAPTKFPTNPMPKIEVPTKAPTEGYMNPCDGPHQCEQLCYPHTGENCVDFSAPGARSFDNTDYSTSSGAVSSTTCVVFNGGNYGPAEPSTCRLQQTKSDGTLESVAGKAGHDFAEATFDSNHKITLKDCKDACDLMNEDSAQCHAIEYDSERNFCSLITNTNVKSLPPCDQTAYTCSCRAGYEVDAEDARKCIKSTVKTFIKRADGSPCGYVNSGSSLVACPSVTRDGSLFCDYGESNWGHCVKCADVPVCEDDSRLNPRGESECHSVCQPNAAVAVAMPTPAPTVPVQTLAVKPPTIYAEAQNPTLTRLLHTHTDWSIFEHYLSIAPGGEYMLYKAETQCHHDELIITARQCQIAAEAMNLPVTTEKNGIKFEFVQVERKSTSPRGCYYKVMPKAGSGQLPTREIWFNTADFGAPATHMRPICVRSLLSTLSNKATSIPYTIIGPTDEAFEKFFQENPEMKDRLEDNPEVLVQLMLMHIIDGPHQIPLTQSTTMRLTAEARECLTPECQDDTETSNICGRATDASCPSNFYCNWDMAEYGHCRACLANCNTGTFGKALLDCQSSCQTGVKVQNTQICSATSKCAMHMSRVPYCDFDAGSTGHCRMCKDVPDKDCNSMTDLNEAGKEACSDACSHCFQGSTADKNLCAGIDVLGSDLSTQVASSAATSSVSLYGSAVAAKTDYSGDAEANSEYSGAASESKSEYAAVEEAKVEEKKYEEKVEKYEEEAKHQPLTTYEKTEEAEAKKEEEKYKEEAEAKSEYSGDAAKTLSYADVQANEATTGYNTGYSDPNSAAAVEAGEYNGLQKGRMCSYAHQCEEKHFCDFHQGTTGHCLACSLQVRCHGHGMTQDGEDACVSSCKHGYDSYDDDYKKDDKYIRHETRTKFGKYKYSHHNSLAKSKYLDDDDAAGKGDGVGTRCTSDAMCVGYEEGKTYSTGTDVKTTDDDRDHRFDEKKGDRRLVAQVGKGSFCNFDHDSFGHCVACAHVTACSAMLYSKGSESCSKVCSGKVNTDDDVYSAPSSSQYSKAAPETTHQYAAPTVPAHVSAASEQREYSSHNMAPPYSAHNMAPPGVKDGADPDGYYGANGGAGGDGYSAEPGATPHGEAQCGANYGPCGEHEFCDFGIKNGQGGECQLCTMDCESPSLSSAGSKSCRLNCPNQPTPAPTPEGRCSATDKCGGGSFCDFTNHGSGACVSCLKVKDCAAFPGLGVDGVASCHAECAAAAEELSTDGAAAKDAPTRRLVQQGVCQMGGEPCEAEEFCNFSSGGQSGTCEKCSDGDCVKLGLNEHGRKSCNTACGGMSVEAANAMERCTLDKACPFMTFCTFKHGTHGHCHSCPSQNADAFCDDTDSLRFHARSSCKMQCTNSAAATSGGYGTGADDDDQNKGAVAAVSDYPVVNNAKTGDHDLKVLSGYTLHLKAKTNKTPYQQGIVNPQTCQKFTHSDMGLHGCQAQCTRGRQAVPPAARSTDYQPSVRVKVSSDDDDREDANADNSYAENVDQPNANADQYGDRRLGGYDTASQGAASSTYTASHGVASFGADDDDMPQEKYVQNSGGGCSKHSECGTNAFCDRVYSDSPIPLRGNGLLGVQTKAALKSGYGTRRLYGVGDIEEGAEARANGLNDFTEAYKQAGIRGSASANGESTYKGVCVTCAELAEKVKSAGDAMDDDSVKYDEHKKNGDDDLLDGDESATRNSPEYGSGKEAVVRTAYHLNHNGHLFYKHTESVFLDTDANKNEPFAYVRTSRQSCSLPARVHRTPHYTNMGFVYKINGVLLPPALCAEPVHPTVAVQTVAVPKAVPHGAFCGDPTSIQTANGNVQQCSVVPRDGAHSFFCNYAHGQYGTCNLCGATVCSSLSGSVLEMQSCEKACGVIVAQQRPPPRPVFIPQKFIPRPLPPPPTCRTKWMALIFGVIVMLFGLGLCGRDICCFPFCGATSVNLQLMLQQGFNSDREGLANIGNCMSLEIFLAGLFLIIYSMQCSIGWLVAAIVLMLILFLSCCCVRQDQQLLLPSSSGPSSVPKIVTPAPVYALPAPAPRPQQPTFVIPLRPVSPQKFQNSQQFQQGTPNPMNSGQTVNRSNTVTTMM